MTYHKQKDAVLLTKEGDRETQGVYDAINKINMWIVFVREIPRTDKCDLLTNWTWWKQHDVLNKMDGRKTNHV